MFPDGIYSVARVSAMMKTIPTSIAKVEMEGTEYYELSYDKGSTLVESTKVIKQQKTAHMLLDMLLMYGKVPWYFTYEDITKILNTSSKYSGLNIDSNPEILDLLVSIIARDKKDINKPARLRFKTLGDSEGLTYAGLQDPVHTASSVITKLIGNRQAKTVISAMMDDEGSHSKIDTILRS